MSNNVGTLIISPIRPQDSADTFPSAYANELLGGHHQVADITARDAISADRLSVGMFCTTQDTGTVYVLTSTGPAVWEEFQSGSGSGTLFISGTEDLNTVDYIYSIGHPALSGQNSLPLVSLISPQTDSEIFVTAITNIQSTGFDVVLSGIPSVTGYQINWINGTPATTNLSGGVFVHNELVGLAADDHPQYLLVDGTRDITGTLLPSTSGTFDLGSLTQPFRELYVTENSIYLGSNQLSVNNGVLQFNGSDVGIDLSADVAVLSGGIDANTAAIAALEVKHDAEVAVISGGVDANASAIAAIQGDYVDLSSIQSVGGAKTFTDDLTINANLYVNGTEFIVNTTSVSATDNTITVNAGEVGAGVTAGTAGIVVDRGTATDYQFVFTESNDTFRIGEIGSEQAVATREDTPIDGGAAIWDAATSKFITGNVSLIDVKSFGASGDNTNDDSTAIQNAIDSAATGDVVFFPAGTYRINTNLFVPSGITLRGGKGVTIRRGSSALNNMLRNDTTSVGVYGGNRDIIIEGITFDMDSSTHSTQCTAIAFGHCQNVTVQHCRLTDGRDWHGIELSACRDSRVLFCTFDAFAQLDADEEMIQLDLMKSTGTWPWETGTTVYDNTPCLNILINGCTFNGGATGIGTHSTTIGNLHEFVHISNCHFEDMDDFGINFPSWQNVSINQCTFTDIDFGINVVSEAGEPLSGISISDCLFKDVNKVATTSRAIVIASDSGGTGTISNVSIVNCDLFNIERHAIGFDYCEYVTVQNCTIDDANRVAIFAFRSHNVTIDSCTAVNCGSAALATEEDITVGSGASAAINTEDVIIRGCIVDSIEVRQYTSRTIVSNNIIKTNLDIDGSATDPETYNNFIGGTFVAGVTDHGALTGLVDDDHTQYLLADGSRDISGSLIPSTSGTLDLGSAARPFQDAYLVDTLYINSDTITVSGGILLVNGSQVQGGGSADETAIYGAGESITGGQLCYQESDGFFYRANASDVNTSAGMLAIALENISASSSGSFQTGGIYAGGSFTPGATYYIDVVSGQITSTPDTVTEDYVVRVVGYGLPSGNLKISFDETWVTVGPSTISRYLDTFTDGDLISGVLTVTHNLGYQYVSVTIIDNNDQMINPDSITFTDENNLDADLTSSGTISGSWNVLVISR